MIVDEQETEIHLEMNKSYMDPKCCDCAVTDSNKLQFGVKFILKKKLFVNWQSFMRMKYLLCDQIKIFVALKNYFGRWEERHCLTASCKLLFKTETETVLLSPGAG